jgi:hypothetical protein
MKPIISKSKKWNPAASEPHSSRMQLPWGAALSLRGSWALREVFDELPILCIDRSLSLAMVIFRRGLPTTPLGAALELIT